MKNSKLVNAVCFAVLTFLGVYLALFQRVVSEVALDFSLNKISMGLLITSHFTGLLLGPLIAGELSDRYGRKVVILSSLAFFLTGLLIVSILPYIFLVVLGIFLIGIGFGILEGAVSTLLTDISTDNANRILNISQMFFGVGTVVGPFIAMAVIMLKGQWRLLYGASAIVVLVFGYLFKKLPYPDYKIAEKIEGIITIKLLKKKIFLLLCLSMIMYVGVEEGVAFWITTYAKEWTTMELYPTLFLSFFWASMVIGRYLVSKFTTKLNELIIVGSVFSAVFLILSLLINSFLVNVIAFFFVGFGFAGTWPMIMALTKIYYPKYTGTAFGIMMACCAVGGIIVPFVMGYIGEVASLKWALAFCMVPILVIVINHSAIKYLSAHRS